jgi:proteasome accessory factor B
MARPTPKRSPRSTARSTPEPSKLQRWVDLLAALLSRHFPAPFAELRREIPAYLARPADDASLLRMFERDKDELRAFGIPIETVVQSDGADTGYRLRKQNFYLPFLAVASAGAGARRTTRDDAAGYSAMAPLAFEPDELAAVADAAARVRSLGDPLLAGDADAAIRKLAFDLPFDAAHTRDDERVIAERVDAKLFALLGRALVDRKVVTFDYHAMSSGTTTRREVEPYGLAFLGSHWYLVARDRDRAEMRNFRLSRMANAKANKAKPQTADYDIPASFRLEMHARSREAWNLGDDMPVDVVVEFHGATGAVRAAAKLGEPVRGAPGRRCFRVRRADTFARWLLSFGGEAVPVEPPEMVERFQTIVRETLAVYGGAA